MSWTLCVVDKLDSMFNNKETVRHTAMSLSLNQYYDGCNQLNSKWDMKANALAVLFLF